MKQIYKYRLNLTPHQWITLPSEAIIRKIGVQERDICLWAEVDSKASPSKRCFEIFATGENIYEDMGVERVYIDTIFLGWAVWHIYERKN